MKCILILVSAAAALALLSGPAAAQSGWYKNGSHPAEYDMGTDTGTAFTGSSSGYIRSIKPSPSGFGTYMQMVDATAYRGKRVRFSAYVKSEGLTQWSGLWMRVDVGTKAVAFDNMYGRPIKDTQPWAQHSVVLDVSTDATVVAFGILLTGKGSVWIDDVELDVVNESVPVTNRLAQTTVDKPRNLDFETPPEKP
jgi:hypothetical protein